MNQHDFFVSGTATASHNRIINTVDQILDNVDGSSIDRHHDELSNNSQLSNPTKKLNNAELRDLLNHNNNDNNISKSPINQDVSKRLDDASMIASQFESKKNESPSNQDSNDKYNNQHHQSISRSDQVTVNNNSPTGDTELIARLRMELINKQSIINQLKEDLDVRNTAIQVCGKDIRSLREDKERLLVSSYNSMMRCDLMNTIDTDVM